MVDISHIYNGARYRAKKTGNLITVVNIRQTLRDGQPRIVVVYEDLHGRWQSSIETFCKADLIPLF